MPTTRRSTRSAAAKNTGKQSTLSFNNKVTKTGATRATRKELAATGSAATASKAATKAEASTTPPPPPSVPAKKETRKRDVDQVNSTNGKEEEEVKEKVSISPAQKQLEKTTLHDKKAPAQVEAQDVSEKQVEKYWKGIQDARIAKRVHQESLTLSEKVLRYFDISSQYGPCTGISRMKRWQRAERLGLHPPIEVLAVLLKEDKQGNTDIEKSAMDRIMASTAIGSI